MKSCLLDLHGADIQSSVGHPVKDIDIGYIGYSNKKHPINTNEDLKTAFLSGSEHATKCPVFYMVESSSVQNEEQGEEI